MPIINNIFANIYNIKSGMVSLKYSLNNGGVAVFEFAPLLQAYQVSKLSPKDLTKGIKVYDYENKVGFALGLEESLTLLELLKLPKDQVELGNIKYKITTNQNGQTAYNVSVTHFPGSKTDKANAAQTIMTNLSFYTVDKVNWIVKYVKFEGKNKLIEISVPMSNIEFLKIKEFLKNHSTYITIINALDHYNYAKENPKNNDNNLAAVGNKLNNNYNNNYNKSSKQYNNKSKQANPKYFENNEEVDNDTSFIGSNNFIQDTNNEEDFDMF